MNILNKHCVLLERHTVKTPIHIKQKKSFKNCMDLECILLTEIIQYIKNDTSFLTCRMQSIICHLYK